MVSLFLLACSGGDDSKPPGTDTADADTDTDADTDADTDVDTDTEDTAKDTAETGDTDPPPVRIETGYIGPARIAMIVDGATGSGTDPSNIVLIDPTDGSSHTVSGVTVRSDSLLDCAGDGIFALESRATDGQTDRLVRVGPDDYSWTEWSLGNNFQPRDIGAVGPVYWVANFAKNRLSVFEKTGASGAFIDLTAYADSDGVPEATGVYTVGTKVYVTVARQTGGTFNGARLLEYDTETSVFSRTVDLTGTYPSGKMLKVGETLMVHHRGSTSSATDGGVETIDLAAFTSSGLVVSDAADSIIQTAAYLDPFSNSYWAGILNSGGASQMASYNLTDGSLSLMVPTAEQVVGLGPLNGSNYYAGNPFDGSDGALVALDPTDGSEVSRTVQSGRVKAMVICASGPPADQEPPE